MKNAQNRYSNTNDRYNNSNDRESRDRHAAAVPDAGTVD